jgi:hypothetical protein
MVVLGIVILGMVVLGTVGVPILVITKSLNLRTPSFSSKYALSGYPDETSPDKTSLLQNGLWVKTSLGQNIPS